MAPQEFHEFIKFKEYNITVYINCCSDGSLQLLVQTANFLLIMKRVIGCGRNS